MSYSLLKNNNKTAEKFGKFYEENFDKVERFRKRNKYYYQLNENIILNRIPKEVKVLEIGCWTGELLNKLEPSFGIGIDLCEKAILTATEKYQSGNLHFIAGDFFSEEMRKSFINIKFDAIVVSNVVGQLHDVVCFLNLLHEFCHARTRVYICNYNRIWQPLYRIGEILGFKLKPPEENWLPSEELKQMFYLSDFQLINLNLHILFPFYIPLISTVINRYLAHLPLIENLCINIGFCIRPIGEKYKNELPRSPSCSIVIPCRNEAGNIKTLIERLPELPSKSEYIFVEGDSTDNTEEVIKKIMSENPNKPLHFYKQEGIGKADAVRFGFSKASGEVLTILDADMTVPPEELPNFIRILTENKAEFVNGSRMVYPMEKEAMRFLNMLANKFFAYVFTFLLGSQIRDTLCGTKVLWKRDYEKIVQNRSYSGDLDPFGDFDLIFGAAKLNLKIVDFPIRYTERSYGETNISRFKHGLLLFKMTWFAFNKIKII